MAIILDHRAQLLQSFGNIATSAANAAAEGIAVAAKTDSKTVDTALKLFGGFDRNEFENIAGQPVPEDGMPNLLVPAIRPPASYEAPAEYFKPLSNTVEGQGLLVPAKDLLQQLEDPRFLMADGLSGFSDNRITKTLAQKGMIIKSSPVPDDGKGQPIPDDGKGVPVPEDGKAYGSADVSLVRLDENGIIIVGGKPADPGDMTASLDSLGMLYMMENTVTKQLQLHQQLDFGAIRFSAPKQAPLPSADSPKLNQRLKDLPDAQALTPQNIQDLEIRNLPLDHALNGKPQTVGEMVQMVNDLQAAIEKKYQIYHSQYGKWFDYSAIAEGLRFNYEKLSDLKNACSVFPLNMPPNQLLLDSFAGTRGVLQTYFFSQ